MCQCFECSSGALPESKLVYNCASCKIGTAAKLCIEHWMTKHRCCCKVNICDTSEEPDVATAKAKKKKKNDPTPKAVLPQQDPPQCPITDICGFAGVTLISQFYFCEGRWARYSDDLLMHSLWHCLFAFSKHRKTTRAVVNEIESSSGKEHDCAKLEQTNKTRKCFNNVYYVK